MSPINMVQSTNHWYHQLRTIRVAPICSWRHVWFGKMAKEGSPAVSRANNENNADGVHPRMDIWLYLIHMSYIYICIYYYKCIPMLFILINCYSMCFHVLSSSPGGKSASRNPWTSDGGGLRMVARAWRLQGTTRLVCLQCRGSSTCRSGIECPGMARNMFASGD